MATYTKKLHIRKNNIITDICLYTTTSEVGSDYVILNINGNIVYAKLGSTTDANASPLRIRKSSSVYAVLTQATPPYGSISYTVAGTYTFTTSGGVTKIKITLVGGGGAADDYWEEDNKEGYIDPNYSCGGGGGSGYFSTGIYDVTPNTSYIVTVGAGAGINSNYKQTYGKSSSVGNIVSVNGGQTGSRGSNTDGGIGGVNGTKGDINQLPMKGGTGGVPPAPYAPYGKGGNGGEPAGYGGAKATAGVNGMVKIEWGIGIQ
ncbi:glycine-rich domain-containing protein [Propionispora vibrioides]|uniref:Glycine-rich domain-containing protein n=1 Tax=Propionispora vibrioides TaxID=112903 RepID=A0A1H8XC57_9FIRM|nr:hypothetical protein [Propionispora vibrioides]SEP36868.1 hypothetical protein SAMN04490178_12174 [Propionispora vibrioides]